MITGRYAPSPSGDLHFGNLRTALIAWLAARGSGRRFVLRVEDVDTQRYSAESAQRQLEDLATLGLDWDEVLYQHDRDAAYEAALETLPYYECYCSRKDIQEASRAPATRHVDLFHPLFGKHLAFTGHFRRSRGELCSLASACGAVVRSGVSRRTDYLVVGSPPPRSGTARALQRAAELNSAGRAKIRLLTESEFLSLVQGDKNRPASS